MSRGRTFRLNSRLLLLLAALGVVASPPALRGQTAGQVVAVVNGKPSTLAELDGAIEAKSRPLQRQIHVLARVLSRIWSSAVFFRTRPDLLNMALDLS